MSFDGYAKIVARAVADNAQLSAAGDRCVFSMASMAQVLADVMQAQSAGDVAFVQSATRRIRREVSESTEVKPRYDIDDVEKAFENLDFATLPRSIWASIEIYVVKELARPRLQPTPRPRRRVAMAVAGPRPPIPRGVDVDDAPPGEEPPPPPGETAEETIRRLQAALKKEQGTSQMYKQRWMYWKRKAEALQGNNAEQKGRK